MKLLLHLHTQIHVWLLFQPHRLRASSPRCDHARRKPRRTERGSVTIEQVIWAGAVIVIVGIVVAAITGYVTSQAGKIQ